MRHWKLPTHKWYLGALGVGRDRGRGRGRGRQEEVEVNIKVCRTRNCSKYRTAALVTVHDMPAMSTGNDVYS